MKQTEILTHAAHVNGWEPAVYTSCMSQNFRLFHVSNLSVRNFRICLLMYTGSVVGRGICSVADRLESRRLKKRLSRLSVVFEDDLFYLTDIYSNWLKYSDIQLTSEAYSEANSANSEPYMDGEFRTIPTTDAIGTLLRKRYRGNLPVLYALQDHNCMQRHCPKEGRHMIRRVQS